MKQKKFLIKVFRIIGDIVFVNLSFLLSFYLRFQHFPSQNLSEYFHLIPYISILTIIILHFYDLYSNQLKKNMIDIFYSFIPASFIVVILSVFLSYFFQTYAVPRSVFLITIPVMIPVMILWRYISIILEKKISKPQKIVIIGKGEEVITMIQNIKAGTKGSYKLVGTIIEKEIDIKKLRKFDISIKRGFKNLEEEIKKFSPDMVFISGKIDEKYKKDIFHESIAEDWEISLLPGIYEIMLAGSEMEQIGELPIYEIRKLNENGYCCIKRLLDIVISILGLIISFPLTIPAAIMIKLESRGPLFYKQDRISKNGNVFSVYKFRTMVDNAEKKTGPVLSGDNDSRVTKVGRILRKTRIDEIPQLYNVLKGDMSLIGPRPERPHFVDQYKKDIDNYRYRHLIKCGITGLAQVYGYYSSDPEDKLRLDLLYANKHNFLFDLKILLQTLKVVLMDHKSS